ncbi:metallophosphoesterase [Streptomyces sp. NPDC093228]|uniref:metallophosphoesterase family protein n=1 Tax=unclassified Streptomyces TaxID=2593676 RepID=UPI000740E207|nr:MULTISPECIES: metallophosphoesterase [unclassified Streptomyces]KUJ36033.1 metallophosphoesterase [Streptomyces sp. NRRL F-5122]MDX3260896.1 metallophosphoesterase [Streptomyces sp. MI02-2A]REE64814.1 3',5'-cyclic AMP phosphodiesterase CpdA [Streptomyces sp. 3212.3]
MEPTDGRGQLLAISDLHIGYPENRALVERMHPTSGEDWLLVAGDVAETVADVRWALELLAGRFRKVIWAPGNHELWTHKNDSLTLRGVERYDHLVAVCRELGVVTPEDPYPVWEGPGGPVAVAPLFLLYDYSFLPQGCTTKEQGLEYAHGTGIVCTDEFLLHPDPYPSREAWCRARVAETERRLEEIPGDLSTVLVNHYPLDRHPTDILRYPEFAMWCGTDLTSDWHQRFRVACMVYGHLHIPRTTHHEGVRFEEVSVGYPREWGPRPEPPGRLRRILPMEVREGVRGSASGIGRGGGGLRR